jgi:hypothetical protein
VKLCFFGSTYRNVESSERCLFAVNQATLGAGMSTSAEAWVLFCCTRNRRSEGMGLCLGHMLTWAPPTPVPGISIFTIPKKLHVDCHFAKCLETQQDD